MRVCQRPEHVQIILPGSLTHLELDDPSFYLENISDYVTIKLYRKLYTYCNLQWVILMTHPAKLINFSFDCHRQ